MSTGTISAVTSEAGRNQRTRYIYRPILGKALRNGPSAAHSIDSAIAHRTLSHRPTNDFLFNYQLCQRANRFAIPGSAP
jgi:hypothetical protein